MSTTPSIRTTHHFGDMNVKIEVWLAIELMTNSQSAVSQSGTRNILNK